MEKLQNSDQNHLEHFPRVNNTTKKINDWLNLNKDVPAGLFCRDELAGVIHVNLKLLGFLDLEQPAISPIEEGFFWSRLASLARDPEEAHASILEAQSKLFADQDPEFKLGLSKGSCLIIRLFKTKIEGTDGQVLGGIVFDQPDDEASFLRQVELLEDVSIQARKANTSVKGNLDALAENIRIWSPQVLDEFLSESRKQSDLVNISLDLVLNLIRAIESVPVFSDSVNLIELINQIISDDNMAKYRLIEGPGQDALPPVSFLDPALTRLALEYLMKEISSGKPEGQLMEVSVAIEESDLIINMESPRTLPLPGLAPERVDVGEGDQNIRIYLAKKIIIAQGGSLTILGNESGSESAVSVQIKLPSVSNPHVIHKPDLPAIEKVIPGGRILLAENQAEYQIQLRDILDEAGYRVDLALDGSSALDMAQAINPDLMIVARNLPGLDGLLVTQGIRRWSAIPIIMLSERQDPGDLLYAFELGVDDYLRKPVSSSELLARVKVCLRRSESAKHSLTPDLFQSNLMRIDYSTRQVWMKGRSVELTPIEYNLLVFMSRQGKQIMPYEQLLESVWDGPEKGTRQGLFVHIKRLREKIEIDPKNPQIINNKWGVGYIFSP